MKMTEISYCPHCSAKIITYSHKLNKPLCSALVRCFMTKFNNPFALREINLSHAQMCNFQKLKYWGLVMPDPLGWKITFLGEQFVKGNQSCFAKVKTYRDKVVDFEGDMIKINEVIDGYEWKTNYLENAQ